MTLAESKITSQGQISIPATIRTRLGLSPGSVLEWFESDGEIVVRRLEKYSSADIHAALFPTLPEPKPIEAFDDGIKQHLREKYECN